VCAARISADRECDAGLLAQAADSLMPCENARAAAAFRLTQSAVANHAEISNRGAIAV